MSTDPEAVLDDPAVLGRPDVAGPLRELAGAAAAIRRAAAVATAAGLGARDERPRAVLVAGQLATAMSAVLAVCAAELHSPVVVSTRLGLPAWVGMADRLVLAADEPADPSVVAGLIAAADARGASVTVVGTPAGPVEMAAGSGRATVAPVTRGSWPALAAAAVLAGGLGAGSCGPLGIEAAAERLVQVAIASRPDSASFVNPAKALAVDLARATPVIVGAGPVPVAAAGWFAGTLRTVARIPATAATADEATAVLAGAGSIDDDFFRDRAEEPEAGIRAVLVGAENAPELRRVAAGGAVSRLTAPDHERSEAAGTPGAGGVPLGDLLALLLHAEFTARYLAVLRGGATGHGDAG